MTSTKSFRRKLGDTEISYFLPSRADGVNDMYLHIGFMAPPKLVKYQDVLSLWALLRLRHPLLMSKVDFKDYDDIDFVYTPPSSPLEAIQQAQCAFSFVKSDKDELVDAYLNGKRTLGSDHLSHLFFSSPFARSSLLSALENPAKDLEEEKIPNSEETRQYDILIATTHYLGDGMALHNFATEFFVLLSSQVGPAQLSFDILLRAEWNKRCSPSSFETKEALPTSLEARLPHAGGPCKRAVAKVEFQNHQRKLIGGHTFPRPTTKASRNTVTLTQSYPNDRTKKMLKKCKGNGVSISSALVALCGIVWSRIDFKKGQNSKPELPLMIYSALNMRPYLLPLKQSSDTSKEEHESIWFLSIGYFNVVLPSFLPGSHKRVLESKSEALIKKSASIAKTFWERARSCKDQMTKSARSPFVVSRAHIMSEERRVRAVRWAKEDDEKEAGTWRLPPPPAPKPDPAPSSQTKTPSQVLTGVSLLGNLDGIYKHPVYEESGITLHTLTTGSRQRSGAMLIFFYTFAGKLWLCFGYDENGFERNTVNEFWNGLKDGIEEFLED